MRMSPLESALDPDASLATALAQESKVTEFTRCIRTDEPKGDAASGAVTPYWRCVAHGYLH
jgi:hypothetical protein